MPRTQRRTDQRRTDQRRTDLARLGAALAALFISAASSSRPAHADGDSSAFIRQGFDEGPAPCLFQDTVALRDDYAPHLLFQGPAPADGGGVLGPCAFFLVTGITPPNVLGFNPTAEYLDGGVPRDPQTVFFDPPTQFVQVSVGAGIEVGFPATLTAYDEFGVVIDTDTVLLDPFTQRLLVQGTDIVRAELTAPGARYISDDYRYGDSAGDELVISDESIQLSVVEGGTTSQPVSIFNDSSHEIEAFVWLRSAGSAVGRRSDRESRGTMRAFPTRSSEIEIGRNDVVAGKLSAHGALQVEQIPGRAGRDHGFVDAGVKFDRDVELRVLDSQPPLSFANLPRLARPMLPERDVPTLGRYGVNGPPSILVYTEPDPLFYTPETEIDQVLRELELPYTVYYGGGISSFVIDEVQNGDWDLIIFDHQFAQFFEPDFGIYDALLDYVEDGGRLIMSTWLAGQRPQHPLWAALGFQYVEDFETPEPVFWTAAEPRYFDVPNDVPDFSQLGDFYVVDGHRIIRDPSATSLATYGATAAGGGESSGGTDTAIVLANEGRTIYKAFNDGANVEDLDEDGLVETYELWRNFIVQTLAADAPWLSVDAELDLPAQSQRPLLVEIDATDLEPGRYEAQLEIRSNESTFNVYPLSVFLEVIPESASVPGSGPWDDPTADGSGLAAALKGMRLQAVPNPTGEHTTVRLLSAQRVGSSPSEDLTSESDGGLASFVASMRLEVHDVSGRCLRTIDQPSGGSDGLSSVLWRWDGRDDNGRLVPAGVYQLRATTVGAETEETVGGSVRIVR